MYPEQYSYVPRTIRARKHLGIRCASTLAYPGSKVHNSANWQNSSYNFSSTKCIRRIRSLKRKLAIFGSPITTLDLLHSMTDSFLRCRLTACGREMNQVRRVLQKTFDQMIFRFATAEFLKRKWCQAILDTVKHTNIFERLVNSNVESFITGHIVHSLTNVIKGWLLYYS